MECLETVSRIVSLIFDVAHMINRIRSEYIYLQQYFFGFFVVFFISVHNWSQDVPSYIPPAGNTLFRANI